MSTTYAILLPSEVVDLIIGNLSPTDDAATLYSCSRVSRTFSSAARRGIFSTLVINAHKTSQDQNLGFRTVPRSVESTTHRNKALASLLADPTFGLALLVRELQIRIDTRCLIINESSHLNEVLTIIHSRASNLNTLSLGSEPQSAASIRERSWSELPVETASILLSMCRTLPVSQLRFLYFSDIPSSILTSPQCPHLHRIELQWTTFVPTVENNDSTLEEETNTVSSLVAYLPRYGSCLISRHKIVVIRAYIFVFSNPEPKGDLARLLYLLEHGLPKSLVSFACFVIDHTYGGDFLAGVDLGKMTELRTASFRTYFHLSGNLSQSVSKVMDFLKRGNLQARKLQEIQVILRSSDALDWAPSNQYGEIHLHLDLLRDKYPNLQKFNLCFELSIFRYSEHTEGLRLHHEERFLAAIKLTNPASSPMAPILQVDVSMCLYDDVNYDYASSRESIDKFWQQ